MVIIFLHFILIFESIYMLHLRNHIGGSQGDRWWQNSQHVMMSFINTPEKKPCKIKRKCYHTCHCEFITWDIIPTYIQFESPSTEIDTSITKPTLSYKNVQGCNWQIHSIEFKCWLTMFSLCCLLLEIVVIILYHIHELMLMCTYLYVFVTLMHTYVYLLIYLRLRRWKGTKCVRI